MKFVKFESVYEENINDPHDIGLEYSTTAEGNDRLFLTREDAIALRDQLNTVISGAEGEQI